MISPTTQVSRRSINRGRENRRGHNESDDVADWPLARPNCRMVSNSAEYCLKLPNSLKARTPGNGCPACRNSYGR